MQLHEIDGVNSKRGKATVHRGPHPSLVTDVNLGSDKYLFPDTNDGFSHDLFVASAHVAIGCVDVCDSLVQAVPDSRRISALHGSIAEN